MRDRLFAVIPVLFAFLLLHSSGQAAGTNPRTIMVFGDSITEGTALPEGHRDIAWIHLVEKQAGGALVMINEGKGGRPTNSIEEFKEALLRHPKADVLVLALGANDARTVDGTCVSNAVKNLSTMITLAREAYGSDIPVLLIGPSNIRKDALGPSKPIADQREANLKALNAAFGKLAAESKCDFLSLYGVVPESSLGKDGVHPDAAGKGREGNEAIAKVILPKLLSPVL